MKTTCRTCQTKAPTPPSPPAQKLKTQAVMREWFKRQKKKKINGHILHPHGAKTLKDNDVHVHLTKTLVMSEWAWLTLCNNRWHVLLSAS